MPLPPSRMHSGFHRGQDNKELYVPLLRDHVPILRDFRSSYQYESIYDRPPPCCGFGVGWCSFLIGFLVPLTWFYGTFLFLTNYYRHDLRERVGLAACAIAALVTTVAAVITAIVILAQRTDSTSTLFEPFILGSQLS